MIPSFIVGFDDGQLVPVFDTDAATPADAVSFASANNRAGVLFVVSLYAWPVLA